MRHLVGRPLPDLWLEATTGPPVNPRLLPGLSVVFCYPYTGRPGVPDPPGWDDILGAHGSTPQALGYAEAYGAFAARGVSVHGLSFQPPDWQREFSRRCGLPFALLSDETHTFAHALGLPTFIAGAGRYLCRLTLLVRAGAIAQVRFPVEPPRSDALASLRLAAAASGRAALDQGSSLDG